MANITERDKREFLAMLAQEAPDVQPHLITQYADQLRRYAAEYERIQLKGCNEGLNEDDEARERQLEHKLRELAALVHCKPLFSGDPRGYCVKLHTPNKRHNTWGGIEYGWGVPTK